MDVSFTRTNVGIKEMVLVGIERGTYGTENVRHSTYHILFIEYVEMHDVAASDIIKDEISAFLTHQYILSEYIVLLNRKNIR